VEDLEMTDKPKSEIGATLLVASTGGHLEQLFRLKDRFLPGSSHIEWVTFDDPQARSLLAGQHVHYVRYVAPRDYRAVASNLVAAQRILRGRKIDRLVSTGSGIALSFVPAARLRGVPCHYIESAARAEGPSLTGSVVSRIPGVRLYTQYPSWSGEQWSYRGSLFDRYEATSRSGGAGGGRATRVVVTLGTMRTYGFRRALEHLTRVLPEVLGADAEVLWQVGVTDVSGLGIDAREKVPAAELHVAMSNADLVIAHAGIGSALTALDRGQCPVLLPRLAAHDEHVDDHQLMIAGELDRRGLAVSRDPERLIAADLHRAMSTCVSTVDEVRPFELVD
jgi:UDP-N-acetylglucosamine transferase subunit ALG13